MYNAHTSVHLETTILYPIMYCLYGYTTEIDNSTHSHSLSNIFMIFERYMK